jgi:dipeptidyl aminopeptidase/acylaminoacyl peptidase
LVISQPSYSFAKSNVVYPQKNTQISTGTKKKVDTKKISPVKNSNIKKNTAKNSSIKVTSNDLVKTTTNLKKEGNKTTEKETKIVFVKDKNNSKIVSKNIEEKIIIKKVIEIKPSKPKKIFKIESSYKLPPDEFVQIVNAPLTPILSLSPDKVVTALFGRPSLPSIEEVSQKELRLAGLRINPANNSLSRSDYYNDIKIKLLYSDKELKVKGLPKNLKVMYPDWSPSGKKLAFINLTDTSNELWVVDIKTVTAKKVTPVRLNAVTGKPYQWLSDNEHIICNAIPGDMGEAPEKPLIPDGPIIQEATGVKSPSRTYQDLLASPYDEALFEHYFTSQIVKFDLNGKITKLGKRGIIDSIEPSPDGKYLLVEKLHRPFSYLVPYYRFPRKVEVWDSVGKNIKDFADLPLFESIPTTYNAVATGARNISWRADEPSTLYWVEAQDKGDPSIEANIRDIVYTQKVPFKGKPVNLISLANRFSDVYWGDKKLAIVKESWWKTRKERAWMFPPDFKEFKPKVMYERSSEDRYNDPGLPVMTKSKYGTNVIQTDEDTYSIYFTGQGASAEGNRPFLDKWDLRTRIPERLWRSSEPYYEVPLKLLDPDKLLLLTRVESTNRPPNYYLRDLNKNSIKQFTNFQDPTPTIRGIKKQLIKYKREDGIDLNATLYLPKDYNAKKGRLPVLVWAYPREFKSASAAGQVTNSPYEFIRIAPNSPLFWVTQGYAVLEGPTMAIIGEGNKEPNDTYIKQLVSSAKAAVDEIVKMGIADKDRIAIGGHSYGAFMTANLLAHSDLFCAGISRSGAYNRTLTPFGFQSEERTLWQAPDIYSNMSPFNYANKINEPLLFIHGMADENPGTFPLQSERMFNAIKGLGGTSKLVFLPNEGHSYDAKESVLHMLKEMNDWLYKYVKNRKVTKP